MAMTYVHSHVSQLRWLNSTETSFQLLRPKREHRWLPPKNGQTLICIYDSLKLRLKVQNCESMNLLDSSISQKLFLNHDAEMQHLTEQSLDHLTPSREHAAFQCYNPTLHSIDSSTSYSALSSSTSTYWAATALFDGFTAT